MVNSANERRVSAPSAPFVGLTLQGEFDQPIDEFRQGDSTCFPKHRVHADRGEPGQGIDLVQVHAIASTFDEEIDARHSGKIERLERGNRQFLKVSKQLLVEPGGNDQLGSIVDVLGVEIVELPGGLYFTGDRDDRIVVSENGELDFGFTKDGKPSLLPMWSATPWGSRLNSFRNTWSHGSCGKPAWVRMVFVTALSIETAEPSTPEPT
jgi:hypothetical protein